MKLKMNLTSFLSICIFICTYITYVDCFTIHGLKRGKNTVKTTSLKSFYSDSSDYKSSDSDFSSDDESTSDVSVPVAGSEEEESPTIEESPVPMSKNSGNRFIALIFDKSIMASKGETNIDVMELHRNRIELTEDHVMFCRKANLYNETFNHESMADILWSFQILSSDVGRAIGHVMCIESPAIEHAKEALSRDPIIQHLTGGDLESIPFYRWRHIRDITLRQDDGREGVPYFLLNMDRMVEDGIGNLRDSVMKDNLEYLIRSENVVAAGPLHLSTQFKDDPSSLPVGDLILFNAHSRQDAVNFAENSPSAMAGLYASMKLHRYNNLDVTGKFVAGDLVYPERTKHTEDMKEAMEHWGYPVDDRQTNWINW